LEEVFGALGREGNPRAVKREGKPNEHFPMYDWIHETLNKTLPSLFGSSVAVWL
jgi:hypothetical protein